MRVAVIGAGAFGVWTALRLRERGCHVTLVDAYGPGNSASSSGGDTRVIRGFHGDETFYAEWGIRALEEWARRERDWNIDLVQRIGFLWMQREGSTGGYGSADIVNSAGGHIEILGGDDISKRYPQMNTEGIAWAAREPGAGYVRARLACQRAAAAFESIGGEYRRARGEAAVLGGDGPGACVDGLDADRYVFACGPWLPDLFPELLQPHVRVTRQEIFYFKEPGGDAAFAEENLPAWADIGETFYYGVPGNDHRGFKIADDTVGPAFHPEEGDRLPRQGSIDVVRQFMGFRFPGMADAPLAEARVCQYTMTPTSDFIIDRHPELPNVWIAGGGSGRGFKHGPVLGDHIAGLVLEEEQPLEQFSLALLYANEISR